MVLDKNSAEALARKKRMEEVAELCRPGRMESEEADDHEEINKQQQQRRGSMGIKFQYVN